MFDADRLKRDWVCGKLFSYKVGNREDEIRLETNVTLDDVEVNVWKLVLLVLICWLVLHGLLQRPLGWKW